ncbi:50S ribosomal protein L25 [Cohnella ginsengisoli]|uniref:Large ribosomal subunit protein bL25 n=1 Tax=Cohnella ginsengisoli TaxID=425004 RepID=A0A9X4KNH0_9BACL|nr:50S ribosomal protein L25 [Cohnella ginsengisoli]MDG0795293.1 50S ribosomal protein L25 [Cohnella ginsengisoli]
MTTTLRAESRQRSTKGALRQLRIQGRVPGVVYGKGLQEPSPIALDSKELSALMRGHAHAVLQLELPGNGSQSVLLTDVQRDKLSGQVLHVDFHQINLNEKIKAPIRVEVSGTSPGEKEGGLLTVVLHEIEVECVARDLPESVTADISSLGFGENLTIGQLAFPPGVKPLQDEETVVVAVLAPQKDISAEEADASADVSEENAKHHDAAQAVETDA